jgi:hypothetical protein
MVEAIVFTPDGDTLGIVLKGDSAAMLSAGSEGGLAPPQQPAAATAGPAVAADRMFAPKPELCIHAQDAWVYAIIRRLRE